MGTRPDSASVECARVGIQAATGLCWSRVRRILGLLVRPALQTSWSVELTRQNECAWVWMDSQVRV